MAVAATVCPAAVVLSTDAFGRSVPAGYALVFLLAAGLVLAPLGGGVFSNVLLGLLGYMLYRLAHDVGKFTLGISVAYAILSVLLLVALPLALYMLLMPDIPFPD